MAQVSVNQLSEWTGKDRRTIKSRTAGLKRDVDGRIASADALEAIYFGKPGDNGEFVSTPEALRRKTIAQEKEILLDMEIKRKERVPLSVCMEVDDEIFQSIAGTLKSRKGKKLTEQIINEIFGLLREIPLQRKW